MTPHSSANYDELWQSASKERRRAGVVSNVLITLCAIAFGSLFVASGLGLQGADVGWFLVIAAAASVVLSRLVFRAQRRLLLARKRTAWYRKTLDRIDPKWQGEDDDSERFAELMPIGEDQLGLFGAGSLFDRTCTCDTEPGRERLASWLAQPAPAAEIRERQSAVQELADAPEFRREFGVACMNFTGLGPLNALRAWLAEPDSPVRTNYLLLLLVIAPLVTLGVGISYWLGWLPGGVGLAVTAAAGAFHYWLGAITGSSLGALASQASQLIEFDLHTISRVAEVVAAQSWTADILIAAKTGILSTLVDSGAVQALRRGSALLAFANNENQWLLSVFFLIPQIAALRLHAWKKAHGNDVRQAIETIANVEALVALGNYAAENPAHSYPNVRETQDGELTFRAKRLGHPLLNGAVCVRNDVSLAEESRYWVISGSNMGGKSTLLRAIGLNLLRLPPAPSPQAFPLTMLSAKVNPSSAPK